MRTQNLKIRLALGGGLLAAAGALAAGAADAGGASMDRALARPILLAHGGEEAGERAEGGKHGAVADLATDDVAYLTQLGLVRSHLDIGVDLYRAGARKAARSHMKHPKDELYAALRPALAARGVRGFADELRRLATLVEREAPISQVEAAYGDVEAAIEAAEKGARAPDLKTALKVVVRLVRTAAEEYEEGVEDGAVVNVHEYQDALGFARTARRIVATIDPGAHPGAGEAIRTIKTQLDAIRRAWPGVVPPRKVDADASLLFRAADRIEEAVLSLK